MVDIDEFMKGYFLLKSDKLIFSQRGMQKLSVIDFLTQPSLLVKAKDYFENVQKKNGEYIQLIPDDAPPPRSL